MTDSRVISAGIQPSAFLDSNVLIRLFLFWDACQRANARLDTVANWGDLKTALDAAGVSTHALNKDDAEYVKRGISSFKNLYTSVGDYHLFSSRVCWSEAHHVLLEARGLERLVNLRVPHSLRVKRPQVLYRVSLEQKDYLQLDKQLDSFRIMLKEDYGLDIIDVEDSSAGFGVASETIWTGAQAIWSHVLMEVIDAYVYAASIRIRADVFISADTSLRKALEQLHNPNNDWTALVTSLKQELGMKPNGKLPLPLPPGDELPASPVSL